MFLTCLKLVLDYGINLLAFLLGHYAMISFSNKTCTCTFGFIVGRVKFIELTTLYDNISLTSLIVCIKAVNEELEVTVGIPFGCISVCQLEGTAIDFNLALLSIYCMCLGFNITAVDDNLTSRCIVPETIRTLCADCTFTINLKI